MTNPNDSTTKIRPGLMVSLKTRVEGGVTYMRENLEPTSAEVVGGEGKLVEKWNTTKVVEDPAEHKRAREAVQRGAQGHRSGVREHGLRLALPGGP